MNKYAVLIGAIALALVAVLWIRTNVAKAPGGGQACTMEAKLCPDGSYVGRTGPQCEFSACPNATSTSTGSGGGGILPYYNSGVRGTVLIGPTCPVMRDPPDPQCADKPYATTITARRAGSSAAFATGTSDANGAFSFSLPPGSYTLTAKGGAVLPRCSDAEVTVGPTGYAAIIISCDTGIR
ncbi:TPA: hypothetical protein DIV48_00060 [Candidatus Kaiserbacteria bacterium]|nr:MAG: hypothetical protein UY93_C0002G0176 [Parcubacteria group bacterium GW2011_GWA1_56_13]KKW46772.1 MAG: hypothetical protein UY97_C0003G0046 [Parcubacteria group bacterium GW2011_GWB1_57_6]HCR52026.1 hypothetical protein [Candidatus Kaiserbacteria bacterium]